MIDLSQEDEKVREISARLDHLKQTAEEEEDNLAKASRTFQRAQEAQEIVQLISQAVQEKVHRRISEVVSSCLSTVFEDPYEFKINFERKRGKTEADLRFMRRGLDLSPLNACGGGMIDVAAFALRVSCLMLHRPRLSKLVVIDEAFRFVSSQYRENVRSMLEGLTEDLGLQIVCVTHIEELIVGKVIEL